MTCVDIISEVNVIRIKNRCTNVAVGYYMNKGIFGLARGKNVYYIIFIKLVSHIVLCDIPSGGLW